jgi:hypothetical protein
MLDDVGMAGLRPVRPWSRASHIANRGRSTVTDSCRDPDATNLTLLCRYHHHNFASRGWTCRMNSDRLPEWIPPAWVDRQPVPLLNERITAARLARMQH